MLKRSFEEILVFCILCDAFVIVTLVFFLEGKRARRIFNQQKRVECILNQPSKVEMNFERVEPIAHQPTRQSLGFFEVTAYCPNECCCEEYADGITASGEPAIGKFCAADSIIPFGLKLDIPGYGIVPVLDRGGKIKGRCLDVFFPTHQEALEWGRQTLEIHCWVVND